MILRKGPFVQEEGFFRVAFEWDGVNGVKSVLKLS